MWPYGGSCEAENETLSLIEVVEFFDRGFAAPEAFRSNQLDAINKLILLSEIWGPHDSENQYYIILGYEVIERTHTDISEEASTCVFGFELWNLSIFRYMIFKIN